jgi:hypothetical protein
VDGKIWIVTAVAGSFEERIEELALLRREPAGADDDVDVSWQPIGSE